MSNQPNKAKSLAQPGTHKFKAHPPEFKKDTCWNCNLPASADVHRTSVVKAETDAPEKYSKLSKWLKTECNRLANGQCTTLACLKRGGYQLGTAPVDVSIATCEAFEMSNAIDSLRADLAYRPAETDVKQLAEKIAIKIGEPGMAEIIESVFVDLAYRPTGEPLWEQQCAKENCPVCKSVEQEEK
jgi:hypothetical protein